jgi:fructose-specific component phosphotransferase system IIB-like protein
MTWSAQYRGGGVRISVDSDRGLHEWQVTLSVLREHFDDNIVANICRALAGVDRLASLVSLANLNSQLPDGSHHRNRNLPTIALYLLGTMREIGRVLDDLSRARIKRALSDPAPWARLEEVRKRWMGDQAGEVRNGIAFHLCYKSADAVRGLQRLAERKDQATIVASVGDRIADASHPLGDEVLFAAVEMSLAELEAFLLQAPEDAAHFALDLRLVIYDLLRQCGARV